MKTEKRFYIFGFLLTLFGIYEAYTGDYEETLLYLCAAMAFSITGLSSRKDLGPKLKRVTVIISWVLIIVTVLLFLYLVRSEAYDLF